MLLDLCWCVDVIAWHSPNESASGELHLGGEVLHVKEAGTAFTAKGLAFGPDWSKLNPD